jgi:spore germination cell wall hydrolase CwlJ-like protein
MALTVYYEARGQDQIGQLAVALVVKNRAIKTDETICQVAFAPKQFSWANKAAHLNKYDNVVLDKAFMPERDDPSWIMAKKIARLSNKVADFTNGSTYYHARNVSPKWGKDYKMTMVLGNHVFYRKEV